MGQAKPSTAAHGVSAYSASSFMVVLLSVLTFLREGREVYKVCEFLSAAAFDFALVMFSEPACTFK